jgi:hypothetical protein
MLWQSLDLASSSRKCVLDRAQHVLMASIIGRLVAHDDVLMGRNRYPNVDAKHATMAVFRARRERLDSRGHGYARSTAQHLNLSQKPQLMAAVERAPVAGSAAYSQSQFLKQLVSHCRAISCARVTCAGDRWVATASRSLVAPSRSSPLGVDAARLYHM